MDGLTKQYLNIQIAFPLVPFQYMLLSVFFCVTFCLSCCLRPCGRVGPCGDGGLWWGPLCGCVCIWRRVLLGGRRGWTAGELLQWTAQQPETKVRTRGIYKITSITESQRILVSNAALVNCLCCYCHVPLQPGAHPTACTSDSGCLWKVPFSGTI